ncbi:glycosyltransferase family 2 protein [Winogradskyella arenosi]|uniref:Glycosyl transferase family 2 n=1 Tax=Winogradskyella arenosi TaxID=533325 RepID=A0A368ZCN6_9FLAO|nr:glycosyltransferase family A protein [Winogradskyella arenosi]RCW90257.1 glycosyl transferase family 2 [Winogradskyella arenosi]
MDKVSVIIPLYNASSYIAETLDSVMSQTHKNLEIIIIDDHSTDDSFKKALALQDENIIVKQNIRKGACAARNYGFEISTGDYIQYLDADDLLSEDKIASQLALLKATGNTSLASGIWGRFYEHINTVSWKQQPINKDYDTPYLWLNESWKGKGMGQTSIWLTPRPLIEKAGEWDEKLLINQDGEFFSRVILLADCIKYSNLAKVFYRSGNPNSISQSNTLSVEKAESLLNSYRSYKTQAIQAGLLTELKEGLGFNFLNFIYQFNGLFPELVTIAKNEFYALGFSKMWPVGGAKFRKLSSYIGFNNALKIKKIFNLK